MLLFVSSDDLKQDLRQIMLLFVSGDDLKQDLRQIMLLFVRAGRWDGPMGIIHQAEGLAALNGGRRFHVGHSVA